jgi:hypothetical protein
MNALDTRATPAWISAFNTAYDITYAAALAHDPKGPERTIAIRAAYKCASRTADMFLEITHTDKAAA